MKSPEKHETALEYLCQVCHWQVFSERCFMNTDGVEPSKQQSHTPHDEPPPYLSTPTKAEPPSSTADIQPPLQMLHSGKAWLIEMKSGPSRVSTVQDLMPELHRLLHLMSPHGTRICLGGTSLACGYQDEGVVSCPLYTSRPALAVTSSEPRLMISRLGFCHRAGLRT